MVSGLLSTSACGIVGFADSCRTGAYVLKMCIYVGCYTGDAIFGLACLRLIVRRNEMQEETCGNQRAESQVLKSEMENF